MLSILQGQIVPRLSGFGNRSILSKVMSLLVRGQFLTALPYTLLSEIENYKTDL